VADRNEIIRAIKAVSLFSKTGINDITIIFSKNKIIVSAFSGSSGESQVEIEGEIMGEENEITINFRYILDGLNSISSDSVVIKTLNNNTPCLIKPE
jgi:DNA polymerase III subunit beta